MRGIRFWLLGIVSFIIATVATVFVSGSFLNRLLLSASCTIFSINSAFCAPNLGVESDRAIATSTFSALEKTRNVYSDLPQQEAIEIQKQRSLLAFDSFNTHEGHRGITMTAIGLSQRTVMGQTLNFTDEAKTEIERANRNVDLKPEFLDSKNIAYVMGSTATKLELPFSDEFYVPSNHFDRETFSEASDRLIKLKDYIIWELKTIVNANEDDAKERGKDARKHLGQALHTLQDFYAHTNWVELGFNRDEIDPDLGRGLICYEEGINGYIKRDKRDARPCKNRPKCDEKNDKNLLKNTSESNFSVCSTAESITHEEIMEVIKLHHKNEDESLINFNFGNFEKVPPTDQEIRLAWERSGKAGTLKKEFKGNRDPRKLTSGYFMEITSPCAAPPGKTRHGFTTCDGLNKDAPGVNGLATGFNLPKTGYDVAFAQAVKASKDYISQIIVEDPDISSNIEAIKALMGIYEKKCNPSNNQIKSENNQKREECKLKQGISTGDPHLVTFDGLRYDLQTVGEFILVKSNDGAFEIQARQAPLNSYVSLNNAVAMKVGSDRVGFYSKDFPDADTSTPIRVNGKATTIQGNKLNLPNGGEILKQGNVYVVNSSNGEKVVVSPSIAGSNTFFNVSSFVYNRSGKYSGLLGNVNGKPNDDQQIRGGGNVLEVQSTYGDVNKVFNQVGLRLPGALERGEKVYFDQLYKQFANSWRVKQEESLFDYPAGKTTKNYLDPTFPDKYLKLDMLSSDQIQKARNACTEAKVTQDLMEGCIFDVGFSGFSEFARATAQITGYVKIVNQFFPSLNIPTPQQAVDRVIPQVKPRCLPFVGCH